MESLVKKCPLENSQYEAKLSYYSITALHLEVGAFCSTNQVLSSLICAAKQNLTRLKAIGIKVLGFCGSLI